MTHNQGTLNSTHMLKHLVQHLACIFDLEKMSPTNKYPTNTILNTKP